MRKLKITRKDRLVLNELGWKALYLLASFSIIATAFVSGYYVCLITNNFK